MVPTRRHFYARNSYSNCGGRKRDMVHSLTLEHLSIGGHKPKFKPIHYRLAPGSRGITFGMNCAVIFSSRTTA